MAGENERHQSESMRRYLATGGIGFGIYFTLASLASSAGGEVVLTGTSVNVSEPGKPIRMRIVRWSTDAERTPIVAALSVPSAPPTAGAGGSSGERTTALGDGVAGRGAAAAGAAAPAAGRGRAAARGGRGARGRGNAPAPADPIANLTAAIARAPSIGYMWTDGVTGYSIKYAWRTALPGGGERIVLATDRRLGEHSVAWTPDAATATDYEFTILEIRLDSKGVGEAKTSLTTKVVVDKDAQTLVLDNYAAAPAILQKVKR
jgi:hypothetical protein